MQGNMFELMLLQQQRQELQRVLACNDKTERFGVTLTEEDANMLMVCRQDALKEQKRVEFGEGILPKLIEAFCDSQYIHQDIYAEIIGALQDVFYLYKNESLDKLTDDELMAFMREQFDGICYGSVEYLEDTCLERFARAIRAGYGGFARSQGYGEYEQFSEEAHWDKNLFLEVIGDLIA